MVGHNSRKPKSCGCLSWQQNRASNLAFLKTVRSRSAPVSRLAPTARAVFQHGRCAFHSGCAFLKSCLLPGPQTLFPIVAPPTTPPSRPRVANAVRQALSPIEAGRRNCFHPPATPLDRLIPSLLSCVQLCPAPPVSTHPPLQLPCCNDTPSSAKRPKNRMQALPAPTGSTLIRVRRLKHRLTKAGTGYHSGSHTPCAVSLTLHYSSHVGGTRGPDRPGMSKAPAPA